MLDCEVQSVLVFDLFTICHWLNHLMFTFIPNVQRFSKNAKMILSGERAHVRFFLHWESSVSAKANKERIIIMRPTY